MRRSGVRSPSAPPPLSLPLSCPPILAKTRGASLERGRHARANLMDIVDLEIDAVKLVRPRQFTDSRGFFVETWNRKTFAAVGIDVNFVQDNASWSRAAATIRGLHFQRAPRVQAKLVRVVRGRAFDVAVDLRRGSPSFGRYVSAVLTAEGGEQLFVPAGFAHGFCTLEDSTEVAY